MRPGTILKPVNSRIAIKLRIVPTLTPENSAASATVTYFRAIAVFVAISRTSIRLTFLANIQAYMIQLEQFERPL